MTREELMINDIVFDYTNSPVKVFAIGQDIVVKDVFGVGALDPNELNPIPLAEEILVKNGFEYAYNEASEMQNKQLLVANIGNHYIEIRLDKRNVAIWYDYDENVNDVYSDILIDLPLHVHNFQHLLRLCGIEKELTI